MRRLAQWLRRSLRGSPGEPMAMQDPLAEPDRFDTYARGKMGAQVTVDIFKGIWSSELPAHLGVTSGSAQLFDDPRIHWMIQRLGGVDGWRVLELGPLEGGHSAMLQQAGAAQVVALEACAMSYLKCLLVKDLCQLGRVDFRFGDFMVFLEDDQVSFDLVVASGVLYHQHDPITCIARMATRCDKVFLWTHYYTDDLRTERLHSAMFASVASKSLSPTRGSAAAPAWPADRFGCELFRLDYETYLPGVKYRGGVHDHAHWMRREDILACLRHYGLTDIDVAFDQQAHPFAANFALLAQRPGAGEQGIADSYRNTMRAMSGAEPWCIDTLRLGGGFLDVAGWAIAPKGVVGRIGFLVDGQAVQGPLCGLPREDVGSYYWFFPAAHRCGFSFHHPVDWASDAPVLLQYVDSLTGQVVATEHDLCVRPQDLRGETPRPALALVQRTHTGNSMDQYFVEGYSTYRTVMRCLVEATGQELALGSCVLDFGCGPGRLTRYWLNQPGLQVVAVDVDPACVDWCRNHLGAGQYYVGPLRPPLALDSQSVDCVLAINVVLHMGERDGLDWLREWARICKPGGTLLVSIASDLALTRARLSASHYAEIQGYAFLELSRNPDLDGVISDPNYYKNVFHSHDYVRRVWPSLGLEVLRIVPGCIGNHYDLVVLQRLG